MLNSAIKCLTDDELKEEIKKYSSMISSYRIRGYSEPGLQRTLKRLENEQKERAAHVKSL
jgi:hypothetical protein